MAVDYVISARIVADDETNGGASSAERRLAAVERRGLSVGSSLGRVFAGLAGAAGLGRITRGLIGLHTGIEEAESGLATLLSANMGMGINQTLGTARTLVQNLTADAASGAGELDNYLQGLQRMLGPGLGLGASIDQLRELNRNALGAGFALRGQEGLSLAPMDVAQALGGQVGDRTTPIVMQALRASGQTAESFRKLAPEERVNALNRAFQAFAPGVELMGRSWSAQTATLFDHLRRLTRIVTRPLFERWSEHLRSANDFLEQNEGTLEDIASQWGPRLIEMWDTLIGQAKTYATIVAGASLAQMAAPGGGVSGMARRGRAGAFSAAGAAGTAFLSGGGLLGGSWAVIRTGVATLGRVATRAAGPVALFSAVVAGVAGAAREYAGAAEWAMEGGRQLWASIVQLGDSFAMMTGHGSALNLVGAAVIGILGGLARGLSWVVRAGSAAVTVVGFLIRYFGVFVRALGRVLASPITGESIQDINKEETARLKPIFREAKEQLGDIVFGRSPTSPGGQEAIFGPPPPMLASADQEAGWHPPMAAADAPAEKQVTNINGPISVTVKADRVDDPARAAMSFETVLSQIRAHPTAPRRQPFSTA